MSNILHGYAIAIVPLSLKIKIKKEKTCLIQRFDDTIKKVFLVREGIEKKGRDVILFKRVSKDFKTQEGTKNETSWNIGSTITHQNWEPTQSECGAGKFHACSRPYFCDEFRSDDGDKYIAVRIKVADLYEWERPEYPHKIAFHTGKVLYECNKYGGKI